MRYNVWWLARDLGISDSDKHGVYPPTYLGGFTTCLSLSEIPKSYTWHVIAHVVIKQFVAMIS